jgi:hypothetical protein
MKIWNFHVKNKIFLNNSKDFVFSFTKNFIEDLDLAITRFKNIYDSVKDAKILE